MEAQVRGCEDVLSVRICMYGCMCEQVGVNKGVRTGVGIYMESKCDGVNEINVIVFFFFFIFVLFHLVYLNEIYNSSIQFNSI